LLGFLLEAVEQNDDLPSVENKKRAMDIAIIFGS
jgi:hypothetical protein